MQSWHGTLCSPTGSMPMLVQVISFQVKSQFKVKITIQGQSLKLHNKICLCRFLYMHLTSLKSMHMLNLKSERLGF